MARIKDIQRPDWSKYPGTVGELSPKDFFNLVRKAVQYEAQESSTFEAQGWQGAITGSTAALFSSPEDADPNVDTVYHQIGNILFTELHKPPPAPKA